MPRPLKQHTFTVAGIEFRVTEGNPTPFLDIRPEGRTWWDSEMATWYRHLGGFAAEMQSRANEYADLNNQQASRVAELEALRDSLVGIALQVAALPMLAETKFGEDYDVLSVDDVIRDARDTLEGFVIVPTGGSCE
jgi:hypothetical protein